MESASDLCRSHRLRRKGSGRRTSGLRYHGLLGAKRLAVDDARCRRAADLAGGRQRRQCHCRRPVFRDRDGALSSRAHRQRVVRHDFAPRRGRLVRQRLDPGRAVRGEVLRAARSKESRKCGFERVSRLRWHLVRSSSSRRTSWPAVAKAIGRADILTDPRFSDPAKLVANMPQLTAMLDESLRLAADGALVRSLQRRSRHLRRRARAAGSHQRSAAASE